MNEITKTITVDLFRRGKMRLIFARQNDINSRKLRIKLTSCGKPFAVPQGTEALINILRADGESAAFAAEVTEDGEVDVTLSLWMLGVAGETRCSISLTDAEGRKLTSDDFTLDVLDALYVGDDVSQDENYSVLTSLLAEMSAYKEDELARKEAEEQRAWAEERRALAESQREDAENLREKAEALRGLAEEARVSAELSREQKAHELEEACSRIYGTGGQITLSATDFGAGLSCSVQIEGLGNHDMITFTPATAADRIRMSEAELFVSPLTDGSTVTFSAAAQLGADITLVYFICRGTES